MVIRIVSFITGVIVYKNSFGRCLMGYVVAVLLLLAILWFFLLRPKTSKKKKKSANKIVHGKYHCVTVDFSKGACDAVKKLNRQRILSSEAPVLPLSGCDAEICNCRFHHYEERRGEERRDAYHKAIEDIAGTTVALKPRTRIDRRNELSKTV